jgi:hypothetical protein
MENKEEILKALKVIQNICKSTTRCYQCPFGNDDNDCISQNRSPEEWKIGEKVEVWRAFGN